MSWRECPLSWRELLYVCRVTLWAGFVGLWGKVGAHEAFYSVFVGLRCVADVWVGGELCVVAVCGIVSTVVGHSERT